MNTNTEISLPSPVAETGTNISYLEGGYAGVVVSIMLLLLKAVLYDWLRDQQLMRELLKQKSNEVKD